jgi:hypothetical protein
MTATGPIHVPAGADDLVLTPQQVNYFETFGFLTVPGLFLPDLERLRRGFEEVFAREEDQFVLDPDNPYHQTDDPELAKQVRVIVPAFLERSEDLQWLRDDPRVRGVVRSLLGDNAVYGESDGNLFNCDVLWHIDAYNAPIEKNHIKLYFYLDPLDAESGALRVIPGSHELVGNFSHTLRRDLHDPAKVPEIYGVELDEIPSWVLDVQPGDLVVGNFRGMHGSFHGGSRRRLFTVNFHEVKPTDDEQVYSELPTAREPAAADA